MCRRSGGAGSCARSSTAAPGSRRGRRRGSERGSSDERPVDPTAGAAPTGCWRCALALLLIPAASRDVGPRRCPASAPAALSIVRRAGHDRAAATAAEPHADAIALGADAAGAPLLLSDQQLSAHGLIVGASGAGKSTTLLRILTEQIRRGRPVVAIDMKGSPAFAAAARCRRRGAPGARSGSGRPDGPEHWNPLQHGNATELKDKLISTERFTEPHYQRAAERYVQTVLQVLHDAQPGRAATLDEVVDLMDPRRLSAALRQLPQDRAEPGSRTTSPALTPDQLSAVRGLGTRLAIISESHTGPYLAPGAARHDRPAGRARGPRGRAVQPQLEHLRPAVGAARRARDPGPGRRDR